MKPSLMILACLLVLVTLTSCYRMPKENEYSLVPMTNNPDVTRDRGPGLVPGVSY